MASQPKIPANPAMAAAPERVPPMGEHGLKDLTSLRMFARVVELQSFSEVARRAGVRSPRFRTGEDGWEQCD